MPLLIPEFLGGAKQRFGAMSVVADVESSWIPPPKRTRVQQLGRGFFLGHLS